MGNNGSRWCSTLGLTRLHERLDGVPAVKGIPNGCIMPGVQADLVYAGFTSYETVGIGCLPCVRNTYKGGSHCKVIRSQ